MPGTSGEGSGLCHRGCRASRRACAETVGTARGEEGTAWSSSGHSRWLFRHEGVGSAQRCCCAAGGRLVGQALYGRIRGACEGGVGGQGWCRAAAGWRGCSPTFGLCQKRKRRLSRTGPRKTLWTRFCFLRMRYVHETSFWRGIIKQSNQNVWSRKGWKGSRQGRRQAAPQGPP